MGRGLWWLGEEGLVVGMRLFRGIVVMLMEGIDDKYSLPTMEVLVR